MATTVPAPRAEAVRDKDEARLHHGGGGFPPLRPADGEPRALESRPGETTRTGIFVALAAIAMSFAALTSTLYVREGASTDWRHIPLPGILWFNTFVLVVSSVTLEVARRKVSAFMRGKDLNRGAAMMWLNATLVLGLVFVGGQYLAWRQLRSEGLFLNTTPNSSFFYLFTVIHAVHVLGGLGGLVRVIVKFRYPALSLRRSTLDATSYYWHFMGILWLYLLGLMWIKI
jgi:cytochrome c oxidase subunit III